MRVLAQLAGLRPHTSFSLDIENKQEAINYLTESIVLDKASEVSREAGNGLALVAGKFFLDLSI